MNESFYRLAQRRVRAAKRKYAFARNMQAKFVSNTLGGLMGILSGADYQSAKTNQFYQDAMRQLLSSTGAGSPAVEQFAGNEKAALQPLFDRQTQDLKAKEAAMGITNSGAGKADFSDLTADQSATLAGTIAPMYQSALGAYGSLAGGGANASANAYNGAMDQFYNAIQMAATGVPGGRNTTTPATNNSPNGAPPNPYASDSTQSYMMGMPWDPNYNPYSSTAKQSSYVPPPMYAGAT